jgi:hypothetical protein
VLHLHHTRRHSLYLRLIEGLLANQSLLLDAVARVPEGLREALPMAKMPLPMRTQVMHGRFSERYGIPHFRLPFCFFFLSEGLVYAPVCVEDAYLLIHNEVLVWFGHFNRGTLSVSEDSSCWCTTCCEPTLYDPTLDSCAA